MPKPKPATRKSPRATQAKPAKTSRARQAPAQKAAPVSPDYAEYLKRYRLEGEGRPRLSAKEFDRLDDEYLELLDLDLDSGLDDEQTIRLQELEYLLLESDQ